MQSDTLIVGRRMRAEKLAKLGGAKVILATVPSGKAMSAILGGLAVNGKLVIIGASDEPIEVPQALFISRRRSLIGWSKDSQDTPCDCPWFWRIYRRG